MRLVTSSHINVQGSNQLGERGTKSRQKTHTPTLAVSSTTKHQVNNHNTYAKNIPYTHAGIVVFTSVSLRPCESYLIEFCGMCPPHLCSKILLSPLLLGSPSSKGRDLVQITNLDSLST